MSTSTKPAIMFSQREIRLSQIETTQLAFMLLLRNKLAEWIPIDNSTATQPNSTTPQRLFSNFKILKLIILRISHKYNSKNRLQANCMHLIQTRPGSKLKLPIAKAMNSENEETTGFSLFSKSIQNLKRNYLKNITKIGFRQTAGT